MTAEQSIAASVWTPETIETACSQWHCPPACQGQIVVVEYGYDSGGSGDAFRRITDRSDPQGAPRYAYSELPDGIAEWPDAWSEELPGEWSDIG